MPAAEEHCAPKGRHGLAPHIATSVPIRLVPQRGSTLTSATPAAAATALTSALLPKLKQHLFRHRQGQIAHRLHRSRTAARR